MKKGYQVSLIISHLRKTFLRMTEVNLQARFEPVNIVPRSSKNKIGKIKLDQRSKACKDFRFRIKLIIWKIFA